MRRSFVQVFLAAALLSLTTHIARAQYPTHTITAVVPFAAGSSNDTVARIMVPHLSAALGQTIVVLDKPGADGIIGLQYMADTKPDGYTLLFGAGVVSMAPAMHKSVPYDPASQIMGVASLGYAPEIIAVNAKMGVNTLSELVDTLKKNPGKFNAPTSGNTARIFDELFKQVTGTQFALVSYPGTGEATTSLLSGETNLAIMDAVAFRAVDPAREKLLAVVADNRLPNFPGVPTVAEAGLPGFKGASFFGVYMRGGTPPEITDRINAEVNKALAMPEVIKQLQTQGVVPAAVGRPEFDKRYHDDLVMWKDLVTNAHIPQVN